MTSREPTINELIEQSSLGTEAAKRLRARTTDEQLDLVRRLAAHWDEEVADLDVALAALEQLEQQTLAVAQAREELDQQRAEVSAHAEQLIAEARTESARIISEARAFAARIEAAAYETAAMPVVRSAASRGSSTRLGAAVRTGDPGSHAPVAPDTGATEYDSMADHELIRLAAAGNADTFDILVKRHRDRMWAVAIRTLGRPDEAADALQEAFLTAFRQAHAFSGDVKVTTWLHRIVVNACLDHIRRRQAAAVPQRGVEERRQEVLNALHQIDEAQRGALVLVDLEGYSIDEAASILGCAPGTVKSRLQRGRARLLPILSRTQTEAFDEDGPSTR